MVWESQDPQRAKLVKKFSEENTGNLNTVALGLITTAQGSEWVPLYYNLGSSEAQASVSDRPYQVHFWTKTQN